MQQQSEFNSLVVHLVNEFVESVIHSLGQIREFQNTLILYLQSIVPVVDTKFREMIGIEDKNIATNLLKFQKQIHDAARGHADAARDHADLLCQELDKRMGTLQVDSGEQTEYDPFVANLRCVPFIHLADALKSSKGEREISIPNDEYRYIIQGKFSWNARADPEKFHEYVPHFSKGLSGPVLDLGCGRGEFLELLRGAGITPWEWIQMPAWCNHAKTWASMFTPATCSRFLRSREENSLGGIFCSQVVEHLPPDYLMKLLDAAYARLQEGAPILLETVNISSAYAFLQVYTEDLTHRTPIHPDTRSSSSTPAGSGIPGSFSPAPYPRRHS